MAIAISNNALGKRKSCVKIAVDYMIANKSFRSFENEQDVSGTESPAIWADAAALYRKQTKN